MTYDVVVIGSGPAGLQGALTLARGQRTVAVVEGAARRNARAHAIHNVATRDGSDPGAFRDAAWADLQGYGVARLPGEVSAIQSTPDGFRVRVDGAEIACRKVLLAVGLRDELPDWPGLAALWGPTVFQCPFCHGHELRGLRWAVRADSPETFAHLGLFRVWTRDLVVLTDGWEPGPERRAELAARDVDLVTGAIEGLVARDDAPDRLAGVTVAGAQVACDALVLRPPQRPVSLVEALGLARTEQGFVEIDPIGHTSLGGLSAAGDATTPFQSVVMAMSSGQLAAAGLCMDLAHEDWAHAG